MTNSKPPEPPRPSHATPPVPPAQPPHSPYTTEPSKLPPVGSKDYVAGQPTDEEEQRKVEGEHDAKIKAAEEQARKAEQAAQSKK
jgi:hypothetical protein